MLYGKVVTTELFAIARRAARYSSLQILTTDNFVQMLHVTFVLTTEQPIAAAKLKQYKFRCAVRQEQLNILTGGLCVKTNLG
ncbi:hypothetical protein B7486_30890 [cyanobacterium TDX16]|nr:hypothetical protein B7486_30890 [cyanobacterium TDX16]